MVFKNHASEELRSELAQNEVTSRDWLRGELLEFTVLGLGFRVLGFGDFVCGYMHVCALQKRYITGRQSCTERGQTRATLSNSQNLI